MVRKLERPSPIARLRRVAVIGAGISGLAAAKCLLDEKLVPVVFEQATEIGGVWNYHEELPAGGGVMYRSLRTNTSRQTFAFSDFPAPMVSGTIHGPTLPAGWAAFAVGRARSQRLETFV
jgi:cation diffusion facilitator CzcD-associated flavoprotein CzcO